MLQRFVWRSVALIDCANVRSLIYALARSHREQLLMYVASLVLLVRCGGRACMVVTGAGVC